MKNLIQDWQNREHPTRKQRDKWVRQLQRKKGKKLDVLADEVHEQVFKEIDCLDCANCCSSIPPIVTKSDTNRIAKYLGMKAKDFKAQYLHEDEDGDWVMNSTPCTFLEADNTCSIYEERPKACRKYPHTDRLEFSENMKLHKANSQYCPAVFHIMERMVAGFGNGKG